MLAKYQARLFYSLSAVLLLIIPILYSIDVYSSTIALRKSNFDTANPIQVSAALLQTTCVQTTALNIRLTQNRISVGENKCVLENNATKTNYSVYKIKSDGHKIKSFYIQQKGEWVQNVTDCVSTYFIDGGGFAYEGAYLLSAVGTWGCIGLLFVIIVYLWVFCAGWCEVQHCCKAQKLEIDDD